VGRDRAVIPRTAWREGPREMTSQNALANAKLLFKALAARELEFGRVNQARAYRFPLSISAVSSSPAGGGRLGASRMHWNTRPTFWPRVPGWRAMLAARKHCAGAVLKICGLPLLQKLAQLGDIRRDPSRIITAG
jgi:hypothetical protein